MLSHLRSNDFNLVGLTATLSEYKVFETNQNLKYEIGNKLSKMKKNYVYVINNLNGISYAICLFYNQLKIDEVYDWIEQV